MNNNAADKADLNSQDISKRYLALDWPAPKNVKAFVTTRQNGFSHSQYKGFNLATHVNDDFALVQKNRQALKTDLQLKAEPFWLEQTHSTHCVKWQDVAHLSQKIEADASYSYFKEQVCVVMTADCLPILFTNRQGDWIAACHAGWRGLADGIVQNTVSQYSNEKTELIAWIGPALMQKHFEVGHDVKDIFVKQDENYLQFFQANQNARFQFDFIGLAKQILNSYGIKVYGGKHCSYSEQELFYSFRRDNQTGRMASLIWFD